MKLTLSKDDLRMALETFVAMTLKSDRKITDVTLHKNGTVTIEVDEAKTLASAMPKPTKLGKAEAALTSFLDDDIEEEIMDEL